MDVDQLAKSTIFVIEHGQLSDSSDSSFSATGSFLATGSIIDDKYRILSVLGTGGMGAVYRAEHLSLHKEVALKTFQQIDLTEEELLRFQREAKALAKLNHEHLVKVFDYGLHEGIPYYTMEYLRGQSLAEYIRGSGRLNLPEVTEIFLQVCEALAYIHKKGIVHRDLKPGNIFIQKQDGRQTEKPDVKLVDFGIASVSNSDETQKLTSVGRIFGSPLYMSPEQALGQTVTSSSDSYSLGCSLFEALTGKTPFRGNNALSTVLMHQNNRPPRLRDVAGAIFPERLEALVSKLLTKDPAQRLANMQLVIDELSAIALVKPSQNTEAIALLQEARPAAPDAAIQPKSNFSNGPFYAVTTALIIIAATIVICFTQNKKTSADPAITNKASASASAIAGPNAHATALNTPDDTPVAAISQINAGIVSKRFDSFFTRAGKGKHTVFNAKFPEDGAVGLLSFDSSKTWIPARGRMSWPSDRELIFQPAANFLSIPENIDPFAQLNLIGLSLSEITRAQKSGILLQHIGRLTTLKFLDIRQGDYNDIDINSLKNLRQLKTLIVEGSQVTGAGLARLPFLGELNTLDFSDCKDPLPALLILKNSTTLSNLYMDRVQLGTRGFALISGIPNLHMLTVKETNASDEQIALLAKARHLKILKLAVSSATSKSLASFALLKKQGLETLEISSPSFSQADCIALLKLFPGQKIGIAAHAYVPRSYQQNFIKELAQPN